MTPRPVRRIPRVVLAVATVAVVTAALGGGVAEAAQPATFNLTVLGTSDTHGNVFNWDYYKDAEFDDSRHNDVGLAKVSTLVNAVRGEVGAGHTLLLDAGDTIQGTPLATYYAKQEPITATGGTHPMARAMTLMRYDAVTLGNHEFNYGLPLLDLWTRQLDVPVLAANAIDVRTGWPAYRPFMIKKFDTGRRQHPLRVGVLGLTNPGVAIWDRANVEGTLRFEDMVTTAARWVPVMKWAGADLIIVSAHGGDSGTSSYGGELPIENAARLVAEQVPGVDAVLFGHAHNDVPMATVRNSVTGRPVLMSEPSRWGQRLTRMDFAMQRHGHRWELRIETDADGNLVTPRATTLNTNTVAEDPAITAAVRGQHEKTVGYVNQVVARCTVEMSAAESRYRDTPILDYINRVQTETVQAALAGTPYAGLPVLSIAAPFSRTAVFPAGDVRIKDVAGLYIYDNTLEAVVLSGAEIRTYLEYSARYFSQFAVDAEVTPDNVSTTGIPDYNYDTISGISYEIDISRDVGQRITKLTWLDTDTPVPADAQFVVAVNNYRRSGGGGFPGIVKPQVHNAQQEIRQLLIDWAGTHGVIDPAQFFQPNWRLVREGKPVF